MTVLSDYQKQVQGWLRDRGERYLSLDDITIYINRSRREIAERCQCVRRLTPISGSITEITVTNPGTAYVNPMVTISAPDFPSAAPPTPMGAQATAQASMVGGLISSISVLTGGAGYFQPTVTITDSVGQPGHGATATAQVSPISVTQQNQEVIRFSDIPLSTFPGVASILFVRSVSFIFNNLRYSLPCYSFSEYQAWIRVYPQQYLYVPTVCAQYEYGENGSLYFYPIPSQMYQFELDAFCLPNDLIDDGSYEAIGAPWNDAVAMGAAVYAFEELQNLNAAKYWQAKMDNYMARFSSYARPGRLVSPYGRP